MDGSVLEEKSFWGWLSLLNWIRALTLSLLLKLPPRKLEPWFILGSFFLLRQLNISKNQLYGCVWNCCHLWVDATSCYLEWLEKLQKWVCRTVGPSLNNNSVEPLTHCRNVASLSLFNRYYVGNCSSELALKEISVCFNLFVLLFLVIPCLAVAAQPCMKWIPIKKNSYYR